MSQAEAARKPRGCPVPTAGRVQNPQAQCNPPKHTRCSLTPYPSPRGPRERWAPKGGSKDSGLRSTAIPGWDEVLGGAHTRSQAGEPKSALGQVEVREGASRPPSRPKPSPPGRAASTNSAQAPRAASPGRPVGAPRPHAPPASKLGPKFWCPSAGRTSSTYPRGARPPAPAAIAIASATAAIAAAAAASAAATCGCIVRGGGGRPSAGPGCTGPKKEGSGDEHRARSQQPSQPPLATVRAAAGRCLRSQAGRAGGGAGRARGRGGRAVGAESGGRHVWSLRSWGVGA